MHRSTLLLAVGWLFLPAPAQAFCGAYVGAEGESIHNRASRIVIAREGNVTALTMFNDYNGDARDFGLIIPVPSSIDEDNVRLVAPTLLDRLDRYSAPRLVQYTCEDFFNDEGETIDPMVLSPAPGSSAASDRSVSVTFSATTSSGGSTTTSGSATIGCGGGGGGVGYDASEFMVDTADNQLDTAYDVVIEDEFDLGEYELWVLRAGTAIGLSGWLADNGFVLPPGAETLLGDYIDSQSRFLALRIDTDRIPTGQRWLSPLQVTYTADVWSLPIRLGTASSGGMQDLVLYTLTTYDQGRVGISNYPEAPGPEDECMLALDADDALRDFSDQYEARWADATGVSEAQPGLAWTTEYSWGVQTPQSNKCDPCPPPSPEDHTDEPITEGELQELGLRSTWDGWNVTRLRLRYTPQSVPTDLMLYPSRIVGDREQVRYIVRRWELEGLLPVCGAAPTEPGSCYSSEYWLRAASGALEPVISSADYRGSGCAPSGEGRHALLLLPFLLAAARRRRQDGAR